MFVAPVGFCGVTGIGRLRNCSKIRERRRSCYEGIGSMAAIMGPPA